MYESGTYITDPIGNNEFSYSERIYLGSVGEIFVPNVIKGSLADLELGSEIVFEEVEPTKSRNGGMKNNKLISCTGLKHFIQLEYEGIPIYIVDNHNHALTFRYQYRLVVGTFSRLVVLHIDQHADTKENNAEFRMQNAEKNDIETFVNTKTNVGNFITAALNSGIVNEVIQIRTDYTLKELQALSFELGAMIVDIDIDFRADKEITPEDIHIIRDLIKKAKLVTIATSPYFMDQKKAIEIIKKILA